MTPEAGETLRTRDGSPRLSELEDLLGDFLVEEEIARTPRAVIYRIRAGHRPDDLLALKVALQPVTGEDLMRFQHEVRLLSEVGHPNVIEVYDFGVLPGSFPFLTMELLAERDLMQLVQESDWDIFYTIALDAAAGLAHIHRHGIVHLDIKPANLGLVEWDDADLGLKIMDFGLAQNVRGPLDRKIRGTLAYTAPEVLLQDRYDHRADLYSLGMTLFQLATGVLPSAGDDAAAIRFHLQSDTPDPLAYRSDMPTDLAAILRRLLAHDPQERYPSAGKLLLELADVAGREVDPGQLAMGEGRVLASRMVARDDEIDRLKSRLGEVGRGRGAVILVEGEEGVGKSRLLREFRLLAAMQGARVGIGRALPPDPEPLRSVRGALGQLGIRLESLRRDVDRGDSERYEHHRRIADELRGLAAEGGPLVLLLEDLHYAGTETEAWFADAGRDLADVRVFVVGSRRASAGDDSGPFADVEVERIRLEPLAPEAARELVDASLGTHELPQTLYDWIFEHSGGLPARIQQLLHHLIDERVLRFRQGEWKPSLPSLSRLASAPGPSGAVDRVRIAALPVEEQAVLEAAAVVDEPFRWRCLAELLDTDPEVVYAAVSSLVDKDLLEAIPDDDVPMHGFAHPGLARTVSDQLPTDRRRELHLRWAELLEERLDEEPELVGPVGEHLWHGSARERSLPYLEQAAERALAAFGYQEAAELFGRVAEVAHETGNDDLASRAQLKQAEALDAAGSSFRALSLYRGLLGQGGARVRRADDRRRRAELWLGAAKLYGKLGEGAEELEAARRGIALAEDLDEPVLAVELLAVEAEALHSLGRIDDAFTSARKALKRATRRHLTRQRVELLNILGLVLCSQESWRKARFLLRRGLRAAEELGDERLAVKLRNNLANLSWQQGRWEQARDLYASNLEAAARMRDPWTELTTLNNLGILECGQGNWKGAREPLTRSLELRRRLGARDGEAMGWLHLGEVEEMLGDWSRSERHYRRVLKMLGDAPRRVERVSAETRLSSLARKRGDWNEAEELARNALSAAEKIGDCTLLTVCHLQLGLVEKDREHWAPAAAHLNRAFELAAGDDTAEGRARVSMSLADLSLRQGEADEAREHLRTARTWAERLGDRFELAKVLGGEARLAILEGDGDRADDPFSESVAVLEELEVPFEYARTLYEWGVRTRNPEVAVGRLDRALVAFERLGAATDFERTRGVIEGIRERHHLGTATGRTPPGIWEVGKIVNSSLDLDEVLERTMDIVLERLGGERGMVVLVSSLTGELEVATSRNLGTEDEEEETRLSETVVRRVVESREPVLAVDALSDPRFVEAESIVASHIVSILCVPLSIRDRLAGAIYVDHLSSRHLFGKKDLDFLVAFADQAAIAIENARLYGRLEDHRRKLKEENEALRREILSSRHLGSIIGKSQAIVHLKDTLERVAQSSSTVLIRGESGTGKGLVARILHSISERRERPFVHFNCAALPENLVESELFGHEKGAFTGAVGKKPGRFELAHEGTIFLDEIGKISLAVQAKLLRVVEDREFERVGGTRTMKTDVRIVTATNLNLEEAIAAGEFREDLYYRLNIIPIVLPPLRERREDVPYLVEHFLEKISRDLGQEAKELEPEVLDVFMAYDWPGNVRELEAAIHRALVLSRGDSLTIEDFAWIASSDDLGAAGIPAGALAYRLDEGNYKELSERFDRELVDEALERCDGKIRETARYLGIARNTLKSKMKRYGLAGD